MISRKKPIFPRPASALYSVFPAILRKPPAKPPFSGNLYPNFTIHTFSTYPTGIFPQCGYFGGQPLFFRKKSSRSLPQSKTCARNFFTYPLSFYNFSTQKTPFFHPLFPRYRLAFCRIFLYNSKEHTEQFHNCTVSINKYYRLKIFLYILFGARKEEHS